MAIGDPGEVAVIDESNLGNQKGIRTIHKKKFGKGASNEDTDADDNDFADLDLYEYMYYVNIGSSMTEVMKALTHSNGGACPKFNLPL